jgi:Tetracyclin repressor-like, C-terminal domain
MAKLLQKRNPALGSKQSHLLAEVCVHAINTLILLALRSLEPHRQEVFSQIEALMSAYLRPHIGDEVLPDRSMRSRDEELAAKYQLSHRQRLALEYAIARGGLTIQNYEALCPQFSRRTLQRDLQAIAQKGLLDIEGKTNQLYYRLNPTLRLTYDKL